MKLLLDFFLISLIVNWFLLCLPGGEFVQIRLSVGFLCESAAGTTAGHLQLSRRKTDDKYPRNALRRWAHY